MVKKHDTSQYTPFGLLLDELMQKKRMSFRQIAIRSGMSATSQMSIIRACRGTSTPERVHVLGWATILEATPDQRKALLEAFQYDEDAQALQLELDAAKTHIATLEQRVEALEQLLSQRQSDDNHTK